MLECCILKCVTGATLQIWLKNCALKFRYVVFCVEESVHGRPECHLGELDKSYQLLNYFIYLLAKEPMHYIKEKHIFFLHTVTLYSFKISILL